MGTALWDGREGTHGGAREGKGLSGRRAYKLGRTRHIKGNMLVT